MVIVSTAQNPKCNKVARRPLKLRTNKINQHKILKTMKNLFSKLMMVLLIALFALPAQADFWATGNDKYAAATGGQKWDDGLNPFALTKVDNSHFTLTMNVSQENVNQPIIMRIASNKNTNLGTFNADAWGMAQGQTNAMVLDQTHNITKCGASDKETNLQFTPSSAGKYILDISSVNWDYGSAVVKVYKSGEGVSTFTKVYLVGDVTGGWETSKGWEFATTDGVTYTLTGKDINANSNFKILAGSSWLSSCNQSITVPYNDTLIDGSGTDGNKNMRLSSNVTNVNITFNLSTKAFSIESADTPTTYTYSIKGTIDGSNWGTHAMTENNGVWEWTATVQSGDFGIQKLGSKGNQVSWIYSADANNYTISNTGEYSAATEGGHNWSSTLKGKYTFSFNPETMKLTISGGEVSVDKYYVKYSSDGWNSHEMERQSDGTYTYKMTNPSSGCELAMQKNGTAEANDFWTNSADNTYTGGTKSFTMEGTSSKNIVFGDGLSGEYTLTYNPSTKTLTISGGSTPTPSVSYRLKTSENNWSTFIALTGNGNGTYGYTITNPVEGLQFMVQRSTDNGKSYFDFCWPDANDKDYIGGEKTFTMSGAFGDNVTFGAGLSGDYTLTFTPNETSTASTLTISGASVATFDKVYLTGSFNGWKTDNDNYKFTTTNGKIYTLTNVNLDANVEGGVTMKVYKGGTCYGYDNATVVGPAVSDGNDKNIKLTESLVDATITVDFSGTKPVITIVNPKSAYLRGDFTDPNWTDKNEYKFSTTDNQIYVLEHVNIANGKLMKVYYGGNYYGHDKNKVTGPVSAVDDGQGGFNMKLTEELKDATITFDITDAVNWKLTIVNGGAVEHKPYYFAGDMNRWYSKEFEGDVSKKGIDPDIFAAEKDKWKFEYVGEVAGQTEKGWYKYVFDEKKVGMSTLVGQFQIIDRGDWNNGAEVYSHNPKVTDYNDASGFAKYINNPITSEMIINGTPLTKDGTPGIVKANGSNFHLDCNGVNNAVIYFLPGDNPKMIVKGNPTDYFIFYSADGKSGGDNTVSMQIVNDKPNVNNYYLPGVQNLKNYTKDDASAEGPHMNIAPVELTKIKFSEPNFESSPEFVSVFGASENVGNMSLGDFVNMIKTKNQLPNGISLDGREQVYVIKIPNGFEYAAGTKFAVKFNKAFAASEKGATSTIVANHLYFFNDELHVMLNVDNYEDGAEAENAYVKLYYRVYGYDDAYNTVVVNSDGKTTTKLYNKGAVIGNTEDDTDQKDAGWVEYNHYGAMPSTFTGAPAGNWHYATPSAESTAIYGLDPKFGNFFVQFKIVTGPDAAPESANGPAKEVDKEYTLYLPEKTLALNQEGFYNFNGQDIYQKFDGGYTTTDVEDVFEDQIVEEGVDAEPIFFNLQGQRVVNPEKGMYIVVKGNKTYKVMIK